MTISANLPTDRSIAQQIAGAIDLAPAGQERDEQSEYIGRDPLKATWSGATPSKDITLELTPEGLGAVRVRINFAGGDARLRVDVSERCALLAVQGAKEELHALLEGAGFCVSELTVGHRAVVSTTGGADAPVSPDTRPREDSDSGMRHDEPGDFGRESNGRQFRENDTRRRDRDRAGGFNASAGWLVL